MKNNIKYQAFTLIELIVVITILAVLATIWFISLTGYSRDSRDSVRLTDLKTITKAFEVSKTKDILLAFPDNKVDISASGSIFQHQWLLSEKILWESNIHWWWKDPSTNEYYWYAINSQRNKFQLIWYFENNDIITNIRVNKLFADNKNKYIKSLWDNLGVILDPITNELILDSNSSWVIDIDNNTDSYSLIFSNNILLAEPEWIKKHFNANNKKNTNCLTILRSGLSNWSWIYTINPNWINWEEFEVYCDMETDWWGWTRIIYADNQQSTIYTQYETGWASGTGKLSDSNINKIIYDGVDMLFHYNSSSQFIVNNIDSWTWNSLDNDEIHLYDLWAKGIRCLQTSEFWEYTSGLNNSSWATTFIKFNPSGYNLYLPLHRNYGYSLRRGTDWRSESICGIDAWTTALNWQIFMR